MEGGALVLLHKGSNNDPMAPSSFRSISVIKSAGKLMERLILSRLHEHFNTIANGRNPNQYGFRHGKSLFDAMKRVWMITDWTNRGPTQNRNICTLVLIDVKNAFNCFPWHYIDEALKWKFTPTYIRKMLRYYLTGRSLYMNFGIVELSGRVP